MGLYILQWRLSLPRLVAPPLEGNTHMKSLKFAALFSPALLLVACASTPMGPTVSALPAPGKPFEQFQMEQDSCKQYAAGQVSGQAEAANDTGLLEGIGGTALGAGLGAALGGGHGAAVGAAAGALGGTAVGASSSGQKQGGIQVQYNNAYTQCMVAKGNQIQRPAPRPSTTVIYQSAPPPTVIYTQPAPPPVIYEQAPGYPPPPGYPPY
jgi:outer membrane lipoprotein SlyB